MGSFVSTTMIVRIISLIFFSSIDASISHQNLLEIFRKLQKSENDDTGNKNREIRTEFVSAPATGAYYDDNAEWSHWSPWSQSTSASVQQTQLKDAMNIGNIYKYPAQIIETRKENYLFPVAIINNKLVPARRNTEKDQSENQASGWREYYNQPKRRIYHHQTVNRNNNFDFPFFKSDEGSVVRGSHSKPKKDNKNLASMNTIRTGVTVEDTPWQRIKTVGGVGLVVGGSHHEKNGDLFKRRSHNNFDGDFFKTRSQNNFDGDFFKTRSHKNFDNQNKVAHLVTWVPHFA